MFFFLILFKYLKDCDEVICMSEGRIEEHGSYMELVDAGLVSEVFHILLSASLASFINRLAEVPSVAWVLNGLSVAAVYPMLLLYPPESPVPSLSFHNLLLESLLCPWHANPCWIQHIKVYIPSS